MELNDLPSGEAAQKLLAGDSSALGPVIGFTLLRAGLIGVGLYAAGQRKDVVRGAIAGATMIEVFVLAWAALEKKQQA